MKAEKVILSFVAVFVGLVAAGVAFYFYQTTKVIPQAEQPKTVAVKPEMTKPKPTATDTNNFTVESPKDEEVFTKKVITITGKAVKDATITVSTTDSDQVVQPADNGDFTMTQTIPDGTSIIQFTTIFPDGTQKIVNRTVTFSTENF